MGPIIVEADRLMRTAETSAVVVPHFEPYSLGRKMFVVWLDNPAIRVGAMGRRPGNDPHPVVWIVSGERWSRTCLRAELIERGYGAIGFEAITIAHWALNVPAALRPSVTVIDLSRQMDDHERLRAFARDAGRVIAVSWAMHAQSGELQNLPWAALLIRPLNVGTVADAVDEVVRPRAHASPSSPAV
jgi:hypothetical protein